MADHTTQLMKLLSPQLRPNPAALTDALMDALAQGWTIQQLAEKLNQEKEPSHVVTTLRNLQAQPDVGQTPGMQGVLGPCQQGCDHGWLPSVVNPSAVVPCSTCRPDTLRRVKLRARLQEQGAPDWQIQQAMTTGTRVVATTYWINRG